MTEIEVSDQPGPRVPISMRRTMWHKHGRTGMRLHYFIPHLNAQGAFEHIPGFVVVAVKMKRSYPARRPRWSANILPLCDHEARAD